MISKTLLILMSSFFVAQAMQQRIEPIQPSTQLAIQSSPVQAAAASSVTQP